jgi:hypothetical protein
VLKKSNREHFQPSVDFLKPAHSCPAPSPHGANYTLRFSESPSSDQYDQKKDSFRRRKIREPLTLQVLYHVS